MSNHLTDTIWQSWLTAIHADIRQTLSVKNPLWLACSGGRDSMALLQACYQLKLPIQVVHVNHQLQAPSHDWQALVTDFCQKNALPFTAVLVDWDNFFAKQYPPLSKNAIRINEQHARQARYQAIISVIDEQVATKNTPIIALAHHANDQAETILLNLCQGTGITGLTGMKQWTRQTEFGTPVHLWRPLLTLSREQINDYVAEQDLAFIDDPTNVGEHNQRAFLREQILPKLHDRFGGLVQNITRTAQNMADIGEIIDEQVQIDLKNCQIANHFSQQTNLAILALKNLSYVRRLQVLRSWLKGEEKFTPNREFVLQVNDLVLADNPAQQTLLQWQGFAIRRYRNALYRLSPTFLTLLQQQNIKVNLTNETALSDLPFYVRSVKTGEKFARLSPVSQIFFHESYKKICQRLNVPSWERSLGRVVEWQNVPIALLLPNHSVWLVGARTLQEKYAAKTDEFLSYPCVWSIEPDG